MLYKHEKDNWTVELLENGSILATSNYKRRLNYCHEFPASWRVDYFAWNRQFPLYLFFMIVGARYEWNITYLKGLKVNA